MFGSPEHHLFALWGSFHVCILVFSFACYTPCTLVCRLGVQAPSVLPIGALTRLIAEAERGEL